MSSRFDFGDSKSNDDRKPARRDDGGFSRGPRNDDRFDRSSKPSNNSSSFGFSRSDFGTAKDSEPMNIFGDSNRDTTPKQQQSTRPMKDKDGFQIAQPLTNDNKKVDKKDNNQKQSQQSLQQVAGGGFAGLDDDDDDEDSVPEKQSQHSTPSKSTPKQQLPEPVTSSRFAGVADAYESTQTSRTSSYRDNRDNNRGERDNNRSERRDDRPRRDFGDNTPAGSDRFSGVDFGSAPRREERSDRRDNNRGGDSGYRGGNNDGFNRNGDRQQTYSNDRDWKRDEPRQKQQSQQPPTPKEAPKTITAGTNKDGAILVPSGNVTPQSSISTPTTTGTSGGISQLQTKTAGWNTQTTETNVSFGGSNNKNPNQKQQQKPTTGETPLQKAVSGRANTVSLGQLKKNINDIVPFPTVENGQTSFAKCIAYAITQNEYSIQDVVTIFNKQFVDGYGRSYNKEGKSIDEGKAMGIDISHAILVQVVKILRDGTDAHPEKIDEYFKDADGDKLSNLCPSTIYLLTDATEKRAKAVEFFKSNDLISCLSSQDGNENATDANKSATVDAQLFDAISKLTAPITPAQVTAVITPLLEPIKKAITTDSVTFLTSLFTPCIEKSLPKDTIVAMLDALNEQKLIDYAMMDTWQTKCTVPVIKREMIFKISSWMSEHKPQIQVASYDDEEDEEFDDGF